MSSEKVGFAGSSQGLLVGVLERPDHAPLQALAVFAHCFTCGKNSLAATRISRALAQQGIATLPVPLSHLEVQLIEYDDF